MWARDERPPDWERHWRRYPVAAPPGLAYLEDRDETVIVVRKAGEPIAIGPYSPELVAKLVWKRAAKAATKCGEAHATHDAIHSPTDELFTQAVFLIEKGNWEEAIQLFSEVLREDPLDGEAYQQRSTAYLGLGDVRDALADAEKAVQYSPDDVESYKVRGRAYLESRQYDVQLPISRASEREAYTGANPGPVASALPARSCIEQAERSLRKQQPTSRVPFGPARSGPMPTRPPQVSMTDWANSRRPRPIGKKPPGSVEMWEPDGFTISTISRLISKPRWRTLALT